MNYTIPDENIRFLKENPFIKISLLKISDPIKKISFNWKLNAIHPQDLNTLEYLSKIDSKNYAPIIVYKYNKDIKIIDGWHRLYSTILQGKKYIKAYVKEI
jgi:hypothetical protein